MGENESDIPSPCLEEGLQIVRSHDKAAVLDAGFDGGEFSGPAHEEMITSELAELAARYNVDPDALRSEVFWRDMTSDEMAGYGDSQERG